MKQNNHNRQNRRFNNNRTSRPAQVIYRNTCLESSGPAGKLRGTPLQLNEKYTILAKDAATAGDMVLAEQYRQYADHYMRLQNLAIENENALRAARESQHDSETEEIPAEPATEEAQVVEEPAADLSVPVQQMNEQSNPVTE